MKRPHSVFIRHEPFAKPYRGKRPEAPLAYEKAIVQATQVWPVVKCACLLRATFVLGPSKYADARCSGPDLDNLMKRLLDALRQTAFRKPASDDSFVTVMEVAKTRVAHDADMGVMLEIVPLQAQDR